MLKEQMPKAEEASRISGGGTQARGGSTLIHLPTPGIARPSLAGDISHAEESRLPLGTRDRTPSYQFLSSCAPPATFNLSQQHPRGGVFIFSGYLFVVLKGNQKDDHNDNFGGSPPKNRWLSRIRGRTICLPGVTRCRWCRRDCCTCR